MNKPNTRMAFNFRQSLDEEKPADIYIYDEIGEDFFGGGFTADGFKAQLDDLGNRELNIYINSLGGSVQDGLAIYSMLIRHEATVNVYVDAWACSIASVIAMAGDNVYMHSGSKLMIHNASGIAWGNAEELRKMADTLDSISESALDIYANKSGGKLSRNKFKELMDAESWLSADDCVRYGLCTEIIDRKAKADGMKQLADLWADAMSGDGFVTRSEVLELIRQHAYSWEDVEREKSEKEKPADDDIEPEKAEDKPKKKKAKQSVDFNAFADAIGKLL